MNSSLVDQSKIYSGKPLGLVSFGVDWVPSDRFAVV
jgi:hypothetical protein